MRGLREKISRQQAKYLHREQQRSRDEVYSARDRKGSSADSHLPNCYKDYIIQLVQKSFRNGKDVTNSIRKMEKINMTTKIPVRKTSGASKADDKATEQEGYDILHKAEIDMYTKRNHELEDNMNKTYSLKYLQHCNKTIQGRIHAHPDFKTKIKNDPIELLKAIEILIKDPVQARYPYASVHDMQTTRE
jgi:hypothetical protein